MTLRGVRTRLDRWRWRVPWPSVATVSVRGVSFTMRRDTAMAAMRAATVATKEPDTLDWLDSLSREDVLYDVGANVGVYSLYAARRHGLRVVAVEPEWANLHYLRDNVVRNQLDAYVEMYGVAVADVSGATALYVQDVMAGAALHTASTRRLDRTALGQRVIAREHVWGLTLDDLCSMTDRWPTAIKIDVDGTERAVLMGAAKALERVSSVLIEYLALENDAACVGILKRAGLRPLPRTGPNEVWAR